jgi:hypothetical protein
MTFWNRQTEKPEETFTDQLLPENLSWITPTESEVLEFYRKHNTIGKPTITLLSVEYYRWLVSLPDTIFVAIADESGLTGLCIAIMFETTIGKLGHTIYLCVHSDKIKQGIAPILIRQIMILGSRQSPPVRIGYHEVYKPIGTNAIPLKSWVYPLNVKQAQKLGFCQRLSGSHTDQKKYYQLPLSDLTIINDKTSRFIPWILSKSSGVHLDSDGLTRLLSSPEINLTVLVNKLGVPTTGVIWKKNWILMSNTSEPKEIISIQMIVGQLSPEIFGTLVTIMTGPILYLHELGPLHTNFLTQIKAVNVGTRYINWYNYTEHVNPVDFSLPLI